jgi:DHA1 family bicyclomycin/chloramphenicol resistance-like MFS transporter
VEFLTQAKYHKKILNSSLSRSKKQNFFLILLLGALCTVSPFSIDMYLPAFPEIARDLHTSLSRVSFSVSIYFIGLAFGQIFYGPFLDRFGRKPPLYWGLGLYVFASLGCLESKTIQSLLFFRLWQALGGCAASVGCTAMVRDFFPVKEGARVFSILMLILGVSPLLAPTFGSFIVTAWGWQSVFASLAGIVTLFTAAIFFFLPEGHPPDPTISLKIKPIYDTFKIILREPQFFVYTLAGSFSFAGLFVYVAGSPAIFMDTFQVSAKMYGAIFAFLSIGMIGGGQVNLFLTRRHENEKIFKLALIGQVIASVLFFIGTVQGWYGLEATIGFIFFILLGAGLTYPNAAAIALAPFSKNAGSASALLGFLQMGLGALLSSAVGLLDYRGSLPTAAVMAASSTIGLFILWSGRKKITAPIAT